MRLAIIKVSYNMLVTFLLARNCEGFYSIMSDGPEDLEIIKVEEIPGVTDVFQVVVKSERFEDLEAGDHMPEIKFTYTKTYNENQLEVQDYGRERRKES